MLITIEKALLYPLKKIENLASDTFLHLYNIYQTAADGVDIKYTWNQQEPGVFYTWAQFLQDKLGTGLGFEWDLGSLQHFLGFFSRMCLWGYTQNADRFSSRGKRAQHV